MRKDIVAKVGKPDNSVFIKRCILYGIILLLMIFVAPQIFTKVMVSMAADGIKDAWYTVFIPITVIIMAISLFRCWRRRWPLAYMDNYRCKSKEGNYKICPRCGAHFVIKQRTRSSSQKVGEVVTTTTYNDGSKTVNRKDVYENVSNTHSYYVCSNSSCGLEPDSTLSQSHLPWKMKEICWLILNESSFSDRKKAPAKHLVLSRLTMPFLAIVIIAVAVISIISYANTLDGEWTYTSADKESSRSAEAYHNYLLSLDTEHISWHVTYEQEPTDMMGYLNKVFLRRNKAISYSITGYSTPTGNVYEYRFEGDDAGTGIPDGWYTLTILDGTNVLINDTEEKIYKQGTEFYDTYAPKLMKLNHDDILGKILEKTKDGEHAMSGTNDFWMEFIRKDNTMVYSYMLSEDVTKISGGEFRAITTHPETQMKETWIFNYNDYEYYPDDLEGYVYSDDMTFNTDDDLGKLMKQSNDSSGSYTLYRDEEEIVDIDIYFNANGYTYHIDNISDNFDKGLEVDADYKINTNTKTLTKIITDENYKETEIEMPLSAHQDKYDFLLSIVPHTYIRSIIDMDKADVIKEKMGLVKNYIMKDDDGNITAEMRVAFGLIGEVIHHTAENEYAKIELSY